MFIVSFYYNNEVKSKIESLIISDIYKIKFKVLYAACGAFKT